VVGDGIHLDPEAQLAWARRELAPYVREFGEPADLDDGFVLDNRYYEHGDAELAYAVVRHLRPQRVLELGSGSSTLVLARACRANERAGHRTELHSVDPAPARDVDADLPGLTSHRRLRAQEVPLAEFRSLAASDVLFVDTSHTVKLGGEVAWLVLDVLPLLATGVWVHFHDIWLPYEYHRVLVEDMEMHWAEQYLLQAFLAGNPAFEVTLATQAIARADPGGLESLVPSYRGDNFPTSFWLRRTESPLPAASGPER
jgi:Methyltransferase domain